MKNVKHLLILVKIYRIFFLKIYQMCYCQVYLKKKITLNFVYIFTVSDIVFVKKYNGFLKTSKTLIIIPTMLYTQTLMSTLRKCLLNVCLLVIIFINVINHHLTYSYCLYICRLDVPNLNEYNFSGNMYTINIFLFPRWTDKHKYVYK